MGTLPSVFESPSPVTSAGVSNGAYSPTSGMLAWAACQSSSQVEAPKENGPGTPGPSTSSIARPGLFVAVGSLMGVEVAECAMVACDASGSLSNWGSLPSPLASLISQAIAPIAAIPRRTAIPPTRFRGRNVFAPDGRLRDAVILEKNYIPFWDMSQAWQIITVACLRSETIDDVTGSSLAAYAEPGKRLALRKRKSRSGLGGPSRSCRSAKRESAV